MFNKLFSVLILILAILIQTYRGQCQLNGVNTINPAGTNFSGNPGGVSGKNYTSFNNAVTALTTYGVNAAVTFNIASGTYNEQVSISYCSVNPPTAARTVTFQSAIGDSTSVTLTYSGATSTDNYTLQLNGINYILFKKMTISNTNTTYGRVVDIANGSSNIQFLNNRIIGVTTNNTTVDYAAVYSNATTLYAQYNIIRNNRILNGSYSVYLRGFNYNTYGNIIESNILREFNYCGVYVYYQYTFQLRYNDLLSNRANVFYGLYVTYVYMNSNIQNNIINIPSSLTTTYGIYLYACYYSMSFKGNDIDLSGQGAKYGIYSSWLCYGGEISNNTIDIASSNSTQFGMYLYTCYYAYGTDVAKIINNKINLYGTTPSTNYGIYAYYFYNNTPAYRSRIANNFISQSNGSGQTYGIYLYYNQNTDIVFNSINITGNNQSSEAIDVFPDPNNACNILNNIAACSGGGYGINVNSSAGINGCDYNDYFVTGPYLGKYMGTNVSDLTAWRNQFSNNDAVSMNINPSFTSVTNLHTTNLYLQRGTPVSGITTDIDGQTRNSISPFIGAVEYSAPMRYLSLVTLQPDTNLLIKNTSANGIISVRIEMNGNTNPFNARQFIMNTTGTTSLTSIAKARLFYTGGNPNFDTLVQFGSTIATPGTSMIFSGTKTLSPGNNYFWLSYAITSTAVNGQVVDAQCTQVTIDSAANMLNKTPSITNPTGNRKINSPMSGIYTINPNGSGTRNYISFGDAVNDMMIRTVYGPVTFMVSADIYNERLVLNPIPGASAVNTVTFTGAGTGSTNTTLTYTGLTQAQRATILLDGVKYITFRKMRIINTSINYNANAIFLCNQANYNIFDSCYMEVPLTWGSYAYCNVIQLAQNESSSYSTQGKASYNQFRNNTLYGGYSGALFYGSNANSTSNELVNNIFLQQFYIGIYSVYNYYLKAEFNTISNFYNNYTSSIGIYTNQNYYSRIHGNMIQAGLYGIYLASETGNDPIYSEIYNNMISNFHNTANHYGIYSLNCNYLKIYHNSIWIEGNSTNGGDYAGLYLTSLTNGFIKNNLIYSKGNFYPVYWYNPGYTLQNNSIDNNDYFTSTSVMVKWNNVVYPDLQSWKAAVPSQNIASLNYEPGFVSYSNLHIAGLSLPLGGSFLNEVTIDCDGQTRGPNYAMLGADEYSPPHATDADIMSIEFGSMVNTGNNTISLSLYNKGYNTIPAGNIYLSYNVNSGTVVKDTMKLSSPWQPFALQSFTFKKPWLISSYGRYKLQTMIDPIITGDPDTTSTGTSKDSFTIYVSPALTAGNYYIDSSRTIPGSFPNFTSAVEAIRSGITGPVRFIVTKGTYLEQIRLVNVPNTNQVNTVTFESQSGNNNDVILIYTNATAKNNYTLKLDGARYIIFKNMTIASAGYYSYHRVIDLSNGSINNFFINNVIKGVPVQLINDDYAVVYSPLNAYIPWNTFTHNKILNGSYGFRLNGNSSPSSIGFVIDNNEITDFYFFGINAKNFESFTITNNKILSSSTSGNVYGIRLDSMDFFVSTPVNGLPPNGASLVMDNEITVTGGSATYGIYLSYCFYGFQVSGNRIYIHGTGSSDHMGIYWYYSIYNGQGAKISKNRIYLLSTGAGNNYGLRTYLCYLYSSSVHLVSNNFIVQMYGIGTTWGIYHNYGGFIDYYHNNINITGGNAASYGLYMNAPGNYTAYTINEVRNNIITISGTGGGYAIGLNSPSLSSYKPVFICNYNDFFVNTSSSNVGLWGSLNCSSLAAWKTASSLDNNSISIDPGFASAMLLYPSNTSLIFSINPFILVPDDIDGTKRTNPITLGAANRIFSLDAGITDIINPISPTCSGLYQVEVKLKNMGVTTIDSVNIQWKINGITQNSTMFKGPLTTLRDTTVALVTYNFTPGFYKIFVATTNPNGSSDNKPSNDADSVINLKIVSQSGMPAVHPDTVCEGYPALLRASGSSRQYLWYDSPIGDNILSRDSFLLTPPLKNSKNFYVSAGSIGPLKIQQANSFANIRENGFMFDITSGQYELKIDSFDVLPYKTGGQVFKVYYKQGSYSGFQTVPTAWTLLDTVISNVTSITSFSHVKAEIIIPKNQTYGFYITTNQKSLYLQDKNGAASFTDTMITLTGGHTIRYPFDSTGTVISCFTGKVYYEGYSLCSSQRMAVKATVNPNADISFTINDSSQCLTGNNFIFSNTTHSIDSVSGYIWNFGDNISKYHVFDTNHIYSNPGTYHVKLFAVTNKGCIDSIDNIVYALSLPAADAGTDKNVTCQDSIMIGSVANPAFLYQWSPASGLSHVNTSITYAKPLGFTIYSLRVTDPLTGCVSYDTVSIKITNAPKADAGNDTGICNGSIAILKASGGAIYKWSNGETTNVIAKKPVVSTSYSVKVSDISGCFDFDTVLVVVHPLPDAVFVVNDTTQCQSANKYFFYNKSTITSGTNSYTWRFGDGKSAIQKDSLAHNYVSDNTYKASLVATSDFGCQDSMARTIIVYPSPKAQFNLNNNSQCQNENNFVFINNSILNSGTFSSSWSFDDGGTSTSTNPTHNYMHPGAFSIGLVIVSTLGCTDSTSATVNVWPSPVTAFDIDDTAQCFRYNNFIFANKSIISSGSITYSWDLGDGSTGSFPLLYAHEYTVPGNYKISLVSTSNRGCRDTLVKTVHVYNMPVIDLGPDITVKPDKKVILDAGIGFIYYLWSNKAVTQKLTIDSSGIGLGSATFWVMVTDSNGCTATDAITIKFSKSLNIDPNEVDNGTIHIYPNPTEGRIYLSFSNFERETISLYIINSQGKTAVKDKFSFTTSKETKEIDLTGYAKGLYLIRITHKGNVQTEKVIIK